MKAAANNMLYSGGYCEPHDNASGGRVLSGWACALPFLGSGVGFNQYRVFIYISIYWYRYEESYWYRFEHLKEYQYRLILINIGMILACYRLKRFLKNSFYIDIGLGMIQPNQIGIGMIQSDHINTAISMLVAVNKQQTWSGGQH